jgi:hypothetical protein
LFTNQETFCVLAWILFEYHFINLLTESTESTDATGQEGAEGKPAKEHKVEKTPEDEIKDSWDAESDHENESKGNSGQFENLFINLNLSPNLKAAKHKQQKKKGKHQRLCVYCATSQFNQILV